MSSGKYDIVVVRGELFEKQFNWTAKGSGLPLDFSGKSAKMDVRDKIDSPETFLEFRTDGSGTAGTTMTLDGVNAIITIGITIALTESFDFLSPKVYDLFVYDNSDSEKKLRGSFSLELSVTL